MSLGPSDAELRSVLPPAAKIEREPYEYATSCSLELLHVELHDGRTLDLVLKDLSWDRLLPDAKQTRPDFLHDPRREIDTYRWVLPRLDAGATYYGGGDDWLLIEKVQGVELWQIGDLAVWESTAAWVASFHERSVGIDVEALHPNLLHYDSDLFAHWPTRALAAVPDPRLKQLVARYDDVIDRLVRLPTTFIHGELYPSNVMISGTPRLVDWEMAAIGPPLLDVAALTSGWDDDPRIRLVDAYVRSAEAAPWITADFGEDLDCCRLHLALQWLGWSRGWSPPAEHARDWLTEALQAGARLGLCSER